MYNYYYAITKRSTLLLAINLLLVFYKIYNSQLLSHFFDNEY